MKLLLAAAGALALLAAQPAHAAYFVFNGTGPSGGAEAFAIDVTAQNPTDPAVAVAFVDFTAHTGVPFDATAADSCSVQNATGGACQLVILNLDSNGFNIGATNYDYIQIGFDQSGSTVFDNFFFAPGTFSHPGPGLLTLTPTPDQFVAALTLDPSLLTGLAEGTGNLYANVPEPASLAVLAIGLPLLAARRRRRAAAAAA